MKRKTIMVLLLILGVGQFLGAIQVRIPNLAGVVGDTITVPLYVDDDLTASNVIAYQFAISYSNTDVQLLDVNTTGTMSSGFMALSIKKYPGYFTIAGAGSTPLTGKGVLLNIKLALIGNSNYLQFQNGVTSNYFNEGTPVLTLTNGYITISPKPVIGVSPGSGIYNIGETQQFTTWGGTTPYSWSVSDNNIASISADGMLTVLKSGMINVISTDAKGYSGKSGNIDCRSFKATVRDTSFYQNNYVDIPVGLNNLDGTVMFAGRFSFTFDENVISFDSLITTNSILSGNVNIEYKKQSGRVVISYAASNGIVSSGQLFKFRFNIANVSSGATYISFEDATINETLVPKSRNGYFSIKPLSTLNLSSTGGADMFSGEKKQYSVSGGTSPYVWTVDNTSLATITSSGNLTAISGGNTLVHVKDVYGAQASSIVTIYDTWVNVRDSSATVNNLVLVLPIELGSNSTNKGIVSISGNASCQFNKIDSIQVLNSGTLTNSWLLANKTGKNQANFAMSTGVPLVNTGKIINFKIFFNNTLVIGDAFYMDCANLILNEGTPTVKVKSGYVTIKNMFTGLDNTPIVPVTVYPNPVNDRLYINLNDEFSTSVVAILDVSGKILMTSQPDNFGEKQLVLPVQSLNKGFYMLKLQSKRSQIVLKFVKR